MAVPSNSAVETCIAIQNSTSRDIILYLEPWAEEFSVAAQTKLVLVGRGPQKGSGFNIDYREDSIVVTGWTGSVIQVFSQGNELGDVHSRPPVPDFDS